MKIAWRHLFLPDLNVYSYGDVAFIPSTDLRNSFVVGMTAAAVVVYRHL